VSAGKCALDRLVKLLDTFSVLERTLQFQATNVSALSNIEIHVSSPGQEFALHPNDCFASLRLTINLSSPVRQAELYEDSSQHPADPLFVGFAHLAPNLLEKEIAITMLVRSSSWIRT